MQETMDTQVGHQKEQYLGKEMMQHEHRLEQGCFRGQVIDPMRLGDQKKGDRHGAWHS